MPELDPQPWAPTNPIPWHAIVNAITAANKCVLYARRDADERQPHATYPILSASDGATVRLTTTSEGGEVRVFAFNIGELPNIEGEFPLPPGTNESKHQLFVPFLFKARTVERVTVLIHYTKVNLADYVPNLASLP